MKIFATSDWHGSPGRILPARLPTADVAVIAGDLTNLGVFTSKDVATAKTYIEKLTEAYEYVAWIPGNHDFGLVERHFSLITGVYCLYNSAAKFQGTKFYGYSHTPCDNAPEIGSMWVHMSADMDVDNLLVSKIPPCDVLVSHGPPYGFCDLGGRPVQRLGSPNLRDWVELNQPKVVICGHIHEAAGTSNIKETRIINVAERWEVIEL